MRSSFPRLATLVLAFLVLLLAAPPRGLADDPSPGPTEESPAEPPPRADEARNLEVDPENDESVLRRGARIALLPVRGALWLAFYPVREGLFLLDRYQVIGRVGRLLSGDGPITLFPSVKLEAGFGVTYGLGFGYRKYFRSRFLFGGEARQVYSGKLRSRDLLGPTLELDAELELQLLKNSRFDGIGNASFDDSLPPMMPIDPLVNETAVVGAFDQDIFRGELGVWVRPARQLRARISGAYLQRRFDLASGNSTREVTEVYQQGSLVGYDDGLDQIYGELRIVYDSRRQPFELRTTALSTTGWRITGWSGLTRGIRGDRSRHLRLGVDVQRNLHVYGGDRVLVPRARVVGVTGDLDSIAFVDLPSLGGSSVLRGYRRGRFRDRIAAFAGLEYRFPLNRYLSGYLFTDSGRVFRSLGDASLRGLHVGAGGGVIAHSSDRFLFRLQIGAGEDGVIVNASLSPSTRVKRATRRR